MIEFHLDALQIITFLVAVVSPLAVGLVTTRVTASSTKAWLLAAISAVTGLGAELIQSLSNGTPYDLGQGLIAAVTAFIIAVGMHYGLYKPTGTSDTLKDVGVTKSL